MEQATGYAFENTDVDQARTHNQSSGSGLGLSIAQWIAQAHGGSIQVQSQPDQGSIFEVYLPL